MTPIQVTPQVVAALISSEVVPSAVKDTIVDRFDEFTVGARSASLETIARYALGQDKQLAFTAVVRLAAEGIDAKFVLPLLQAHLLSLSLVELAPVLDSLGGKYRELTEANGRRPSIANTNADRALADRLQTLGVVSSVDQRGAELKVNMRRP